MYRYVNNPVVEKIVAQPEDYIFSSARDHKIALKWS